MKMKILCISSYKRYSVNNKNIETYSSTQDSVTGTETTTVTATDTAVTTVSGTV